MIPLTFHIVKWFINRQFLEKTTSSIKQHALIRNILYIPNACEICISCIYRHAHGSSGNSLKWNLLYQKFFTFFNLISLKYVKQFKQYHNYVYYIYNYYNMHVHTIQHYVKRHFYWWNKLERSLRMINAAKDIYTIDVINASTSQIINKIWNFNETSPRVYSLIDIIFESYIRD